jgi:hypothetical protein
LIHVRVVTVRRKVFGQVVQTDILKFVMMREAAFFWPQRELACERIRPSFGSPSKISGSAAPR